MSDEYGETGKEHMEPSEPGEENTAGRDLMILTLFISNIFIYLQVNKIAGKMDTVYASNVNLSELSEALEHVQKDMGDYVSVKSSDSLESYYKSQQEYQGLLERLNDKTIDKPGKNPGKRTSA